MATITSDAPSLVVGAALCLVALAVVRGQVPWWWLAPAAAATTAVKATGLAVVGLVAVFLLLHLARPSRDGITTTDPADDRADAAGVRSRSAARPGLRTSLDHPAQLPRRTVWLATAAVVLPAGAVLAFWMLVNALTDLPAAAEPPCASTSTSTPSAGTELIGNALNLTSPLQNGYLPPFMTDPTSRS